MSQVKVVLIGTGGWWPEQHIRVLQAHSDIDLVAICGRDAKTIEARASKYGVKGYTNADNLLDTEKPDLVSLCLSNKHHFETTMKVIEKGYPLFVEKPLVFHMDEANQLIEAAEKQDLFFALNFNHRYAKPVQLAHQAIQADKLGDINFVTWRFGGDGPNSLEHENLIETQCHGFDMLEFLCGPIQSVAAQMLNTDRKNSTMAIALSFQKGAVGSLVGSYDTSYAYPNTHRVEVNGNKGRVVIHDTVKKYSFHELDNETYQVWESGYFNDIDREFHRTFDKHLDVMIQHFKDGKAPPVHAKAGRRALELAQACIKSYENKTFVKV